MTGVLKAQRLFRPGKDPNGGDENGSDDFACEEREQPIVRTLALSIALDCEPFSCEQEPIGWIAEQQQR